MTTASSREPRHLLTAGLAAVSILLTARTAEARPRQPAIENPVYVDDSPSAAQVISEIDGLVGRGNTSEAVRALQRVLDAEPDRLVAQESNLFRPARALVHEALLARPELLERYRVSADPLAAQLLQQGEAHEVERRLLLTVAGFDATLIVAESHLASGSFAAASRTLMQLDQHPARASDTEGRAASLMATVARFSDDERDRARALRWADDAGVQLRDDALAPVNPPAAALREGYGSFNAMDAAEVGRLLPRPLRSVPLDPRTLDGSRTGPAGQTPWVLPSVAGEMLLINDGERVAAFDAASLERIWTYEADIEGFQGNEFERARRANSPREDTQTVTVGGGVVLAVTGDAVARRRIGDPRLHAVSLETGELIWNARPAGIHADLTGATMFGPPVISGDTAVIGFFTFSPLRRVHIAHLAGLDLYTGRTRWMHMIGTAGVLPSQRGVDVATAMLLSRGVAYRVEPLGVIAAMETGSGRPLWTRRIRATDEEPPPRDAWEQPVPVAAGDSIIAFSPDGTRLMRLHAETGALEASRRMSEVGWPDYFLRAGEHLVLITNTRVQTIPITEALTGQPTPIDLNGSPVMGRGIVSGDRVLLPTDRGVIAIDPREGRARRVVLEHGGSPAVSRGQLLVYGAGTVHGYLDWNTAERVLTARIAANPADPQHAIALAELAYRADRAERVPLAADAALNAIGQIEDAAEATTSRERLFASLASILDGDREIGLRDQGDIVERLGLAARTADERVGHLMQRGRWLDKRGDHREAAETYQAILLDDALARASYNRSWRRQRADLAATTAIADVVEREGAGVYRAFDRAAETALATIQNSGDDAPASRMLAQQFETIARHYPLAKAAPDAWLAAFNAHTIAGDERRALAALHAGFDSAILLTRKRAEASTVAEIAGQLAARLAADQRYFEATRVLRRARELMTELRLTASGEPIDAAGLEQSLTRSLSEHDRRPRIAEMPEAMSQLLEGWSIVPPASRSGPRAPSHVMMRSTRHGVLALWSAGGQSSNALGFTLSEAERAELDEADAMKPLWSRALGEAPVDEPELLQLTPARALLARRAHTQLTIEAIDTVSGQTTWTTPAFGDLFDTDPPRYSTGVIETPLDGRAWLRDHVVAIDDRYMAIVERTGRAIAIDLESGAVAWATQLDVPAVYEISLRGGVLTVIGERSAEPARGEAPGAIPLTAAYDIPSKTTLFGPKQLRSFARWVRHERGAPLLIGLDSGILAMDVARGEEQWTVDDPAVRLSGDAWVVRDRMYVMGADRQLWQVGLTQGTLRTEPLEDLGRVGEAEEIRVESLPTGEALFVTTEGIVVFEPSGRLVGGDGFDGTRAFRLPATAERLVIAIDARTRSGDANSSPQTEGMPFGFVAMDHRTGRIRAEATLLLHGYPESITALDDLILVETDDSTAVYQASPDENQR